MATSTFDSFSLISCCASCMTPESSGRKMMRGLYTSRSFVLSRQGILRLRYETISMCQKSCSTKREQKNISRGIIFSLSPKIINEISSGISSCLPGKTNNRNYEPPFYKNNQGSTSMRKAFKRGRRFLCVCGSWLAVTLGSSSGYASMRSYLTWKKWGGRGTQMSGYRNKELPTIREFRFFLWMKKKIIRKN